MEAEARADRLRRFRGPVEQHDAETVERWRAASPADHASAMIQLAEYAQDMVSITGHGKDPAEMFPGFPTLQRGAAAGDQE